VETRTIQIIDLLPHSCLLYKARLQNETRSSRWGYDFAA